MSEKRTSSIYRLLRRLVELFYPAIEVVGEENLPHEPCIVVGNHSQMNGPIACELYFPGRRYIWCAGEMMHLKEVPAYAYRDFWSAKPRWSRPFWKVLSYIISPLSVCVFNNAHTVPVYRDARLLTTFRRSMELLGQGENIIIFPEHDEPCNNIICDFQDKFVDLARLYYKKTGVRLSFVPMYLAPRLKKIYLGKPLRFCPETPIKEERGRICGYLMEKITETAVSLPKHRVVPYSNVPKKNYPFNIPLEVKKYEKTGG